MADVPFPNGWLSAMEKIVSAFMARATDIDYRALYGATVLFVEGNRATVRPDDMRLGDSLVCTLRRPDGYSSVPASGTACFIGWDGYNPSKRYAIMAATSGQAVEAVAVQAARVDLGDTDGSTVLKSAVGSALVGFAVALGASTDTAVQGAANALLISLVGSSNITVPPATPSSPLLAQNVTSKTHAS